MGNAPLKWVRRLLTIAHKPNRVTTITVDGILIHLNLGKRPSDIYLTIPNFNVIQRREKEAMVSWCLLVIPHIHCSSTDRPTPYRDFFNRFECSNLN